MKLHASVGIVSTLEHTSEFLGIGWQVLPKAWNYHTSLILKLGLTNFWLIWNRYMYLLSKLVENWYRCWRYCWYQVQAYVTDWHSFIWVWYMHVNPFLFQQGIDMNILRNNIMTYQVLIHKQYIFHLVWQGIVDHLKSHLTMYMHISKGTLEA